MARARIVNGWSVVPGEGFEPPCPKAAGFKPAASASSATPARFAFRPLQSVGPAQSPAHFSSASLWHDIVPHGRHLSLARSRQFCQLSPAPTLDQRNEEVLRGILGLNAADYQRLIDDGIVGTACLEDATAQ